MDSRSDAFVRKFSDALKYLGSSSIQDLVSIKYRDGGNSSDYREFIEGYLQSEMNLETKPVQGDFQGHAWLVSDKRNNKALLVEHETGLEILYIAGSIASLLSFIPLINSGWKFLHSRFSDRPFFHDRGMGVEVRIVDSKKQLVEQHVLRIEDFILSESMKEIASLKARVEQLEQELRETKEKQAKKGGSKKSTRPAQRTRSK